MLGVAAALGGALPAAAHVSKIRRNGLYGHATKGPLTPVCSVSVPCSGPATSARIGFAMRGRAIRWIRTDRNGDYRVGLPPGRYKLKSRIGFGVVHPAFVRVTAGRYARADLTLDTGIR